MEKIYISITIVFLILCAQLNAFGQCPRVSSCIPGDAPDFLSGNGIFEVKLHQIQNVSGGVAEGYKDFSCNIGTELTVSVPYQVYVKTGDFYNENVKIWIDLDDDGVLGTGELMFESNDKREHQGIITLPQSTKLDTRLRMRVGSDFQSSLADPCATSGYSQSEDYYIVSRKNNQKPIASLYSRDSVTCNGMVELEDRSINSPTKWKWYFGDGDSSELQNPVHQYKKPGLYDITLKVENDLGSDLVEKVDYVVYNGVKPIPTNCIPHTQNYCCGYGIVRVKIAGLEVTSSSGVVGYEDFTCNNLIYLSMGNKYQMYVEVNSALSEDIMAWIDFNNDGSFEAKEQIFNINNATGTVSGSVSIPIVPNLENKPLRMRLMSDYSGRGLDPCTNVEHGQTEDYTVILRTNQSPPLPLFGVDNQNSCTGEFSFTDESDNGPSSWHWDFGDGSGSTLKSPFHKYASHGNYTVTLSVCNSNGCDTLEKQSFVTFTNRCDYCLPAKANSASNSISNFLFNFITNVSTGSSTGYSDYTSISTPVEIGGTYPIDISNNGWWQSYFYVWIDFNGDGIFSQVEMVFNGYGTNVYGNVKIPQQAMVGNTRLRVLVTSNGDQDPCVLDYTNGEVEDYTVIIKDVTLPPVASFTVLNQAPCNKMASFVDLSNRQANSWYWDFGDGGTSFAKNPTHVYASAGVYDVSLKVCNVIGCDSIKMVNYITINQGNTCTYCVPSAGSNVLYYIEDVTLNSVSNHTGTVSQGYERFSNVTIPLKQGDSYTLELNKYGGYYMYYAAWIDYNMDGVFDSSEKLFAAGNYMTSKLNAIFAVPKTAQIGNTVMRIKSAPVFCLNNLDDPCADNCNGEIEDYVIRIDQSDFKPESRFEVDAPFTCNGYVNFKDLSGLSPTSWYWDFGDGTSSSFQNPSHQYKKNGHYTVRLKTCNQNGCDSVIKNNVIGYLDTCYCIPLRVVNSSNFIKEIVVGEYSRQSSYNSQGYEYWYTDSIMLYAGEEHYVQINPRNLNTGYATFWVDLNFDHRFTDDEMLLGLQGYSLGGYLKIPEKLSWEGTSLMRIIYSEKLNDVLDPCTSFLDGEIEDYPVLLGRSKKKNNILDVYPNPTDGIFHLFYDMYKEEEVALRIYNLYGEVVCFREFGLNKFLDVSVDFSGCLEGVYFLVVTTPSRKNSFKIIKNR